MLVLSRKEGEEIIVGDDIVIEVRKIFGNRVRLAIKAPRDVRIRRGELEFEITTVSNGSHGELKLNLGELARQASAKLGASVQASSAS